MVHPIESILKDALVLSEQDRVALVRRLIESFDSEADAEAEQAWAQEVARRLERIDRGEAKMVPGSEVRREVQGMIDGQVDG